MEVLAAWRSTHPPCPFLNSTHTLTRYLDANNGDVAKAKEALLATQKWRRESLAPGFSCAPCAAAPGEHCFIPLGLDATGAALVYGCPARAAGNAVEDTVAHVVHALEKQFDGEEGDAQPRRWVWVVDFSGFGFSHAMNARLGLAFGAVFRAHFPERLKSIILINPPLLFKTLLLAINAIADERTVAKLITLSAGSPAEVVDALRARFHVHSEPVLAWLLAALGSPPTPGTLPPLPPALLPLQV